MDKAKLKAYAPEARKEFIKMVTERAAYYGISKSKTEECVLKGDFGFISGRAIPKQIVESRKGLISRIDKSSFSQVMEEIAYTWFNRIAAIRFMEVNGYLSHGYRVFSHPEGHSEPEILEKAQFLDHLDGLEKEEIISLKTEPGKENELYRKILIAQCNELNKAMPFLFEKVDDPTELLLPDNLLNTDSVIRNLVKEIPEEDWKEVEIIGWLYQFYISEKKDALMKAKKAYKTEDIPAVTQLFTPNWIVKYLVQNSLGAKWLSTYPTSGIKSKMKYYVEPAEQDKDVKAKLKEITPTSLDPEELTVMDPACGSGHILVEAYALLKEIYLERGYRAKDIPALILKKNLFGLEIDERAAQLAGFALVMRARQDDREIFKKDIEPKVVCLKNADGYGEHFKEAKELIDLFENAKTFGSLIKVPEDLKEKLIEIEKVLEKKKRGDIFEQKDAEVVQELLKQAELLSKKYDFVIANPPYMGSGKFNGLLKDYANSVYNESKLDLFAMFIERGIEFIKDKSDSLSMIAPQVWMFSERYTTFRTKILQCYTLLSLVHNGFGAFGADLGTAAFTFLNNSVKDYKGNYLKLIHASDSAEKSREFFNKKNIFKNTQSVFFKIPINPIAYWLRTKTINLFLGTKVGDLIEAREGLTTADNDRFLRNWHEIRLDKISFKCSNNEDSIRGRKKWFPYIKGGEYRKWFGNLEYVVNWQNDGHEIKNNIDKKTKRVRSHNYNGDYAFREGLTWAGFSSSKISLRYVPSGFMFDAKGPMGFSENKDSLMVVIALLNSKPGQMLIKTFSQTIDFKIGHVLRLPVKEELFSNNVLTDYIWKCIELSQKDWDNFEYSWNFSIAPMLQSDIKGKNLKSSYKKWEQVCNDNKTNIKQLEEIINRLFIEAYELQDELTPDVPEEEITLAHAKKEEDIKRLISYSIGCMMGRYSLDKPGLIYAHSGNEGFDKSKYKTFPADDDGIIPITDHEWFDDDAACRFFKFIETVWGKKSLDENLDFILDAIGKKSNEISREAIRRYFLNDFFKDHCQTYKKRPIYWLFSSGKQKAFQALVYLHRYNEGTLSRMRTEYVLPLQTKVARYIEHLEKDKESAAGSQAAKIQKEIAVFKNQQTELSDFDDLLRHYADKRIKLDLDDGVKDNYGKFGDLLADVKMIAAKTKDE